MGALRYFLIRPADPALELGAKSKDAELEAAPCVWCPMPLRRMKPLALRRLTPAERALASEMFGPALKPDRVRLFALPVWRRAFAPTGWLIVWPAAAAPCDFGEEPTPVQGMFVHELTHVWQAQHGVCLPIAKLRAGDSARSYCYDLAAAPEFTALNIEQQAMVVEHAFLSRRGHAAPHPPELYAAISRNWQAG
jgi:hypothetical protein